MKINNNKIKSLFLLSLVGSGAGKNENSEKQPEIATDGVNLNSLPQTATNLTKRQNNPDKTLFFGGYPISIENRKSCTTGFSVVTSGCQDAGKNGFITSSRCCVNCGGKDNILIQDGSLLGSSLYSSFAPLPPSCPDNPSDCPLDYLYATIDMPDIEPVPYVIGNSELYSITSSWALTEPGFTVCTFGAGNGYFCGNVTEFNLVLAFVDPQDNSNGIFKGLNKVEIGVYDFNFKPGEDLTNENLGAPVYLADLYKNVGHTTARILGHITFISNDDWTHKSFYYTPIDTALQDLGKKANCEFQLLIDEASAEKVQAQIEVPAKK